MPIYGYRCTQCGRTLEMFQRVNDPPPKGCPHCQSPLQKQIFPVGVIFKGSGFYTTDYGGSKSDASRSSEPKTTPDSAKPESSQASGESSKPESKAD